MKHTHTHGKLHAEIHTLKTKHITHRKNTQTQITQENKQKSIET